MKGLLKILSAGIMAVSMVTIAMANIEGSPHDISTNQCGICHTPKTDKVGIPLWNATEGAASHKPFTSEDNFGNTAKHSDDSAQSAPYHSTTSDMNDDHKLGAESMLCLGCHNGIISNSIKSDGFSGDTTDLGNDLKDDHPVGFSYEPKRDMNGNNFPDAITVPGKSGNWAIKGYSGALYPLYGSHHNRFECTTCHNPHYEAGHPAKTGEQSHLLLRADNLGSTMCRDCHRAM